MLATQIPDNASITVADAAVEADPEGLRQLLMNLIWNAVKYPLHPRGEHGGGHGAGLTLARRIVERHGGTIWIDSAPDEGTTVSFTLESV